MSDTNAEGGVARKSKNDAESHNKTKPTQTHHSECGLNTYASVTNPAIHKAIAITMMAFSACNDGRCVIADRYAVGTTMLALGYKKTLCTGEEIAVSQYSVVADAHTGAS
ncbi:MAG: hypothetical protein A3C11_01300 [Candidatus Sungbacteria bacterium RIFCSPHIGHO2_02_FULL_49_12]|uniref:Uncharacterized protein n=1 Tax=Candidatus Sungbacteria bacterium RIFCSPHIGHO2_02_FULL_49_12 TaxID=1802271 RepID=A0A1G2KLL2_9BACT|nr:MAG: hypothetical protein A3C11_01300 [Candidatus Sungbacteria bacterium RIFCSPHIGHO2_02_FULL_49_12]